MEKFDLLVIGSGPGGQRAAIQAAKLGKSVALVERRQIVGGVTAHTGTIPSITLVDSRSTILDFVDSDIVDEFRHDLQSRGIQLRLGEEVSAVDSRSNPPTRRTCRTSMRWVM